MTVSMNAIDHLIAQAPEIQAGIMKSHSDLHISRLPVACRFGAGLRGFVCRFRGKFPEISRQNGKCGCKLLILLGGNSTGSQEVAGSIPASSTNRINGLANLPNINNCSGVPLGFQLALLQIPQISPLAC
jgi:hypothetical protein